MKTLRVTIYIIPGPSNIDRQLNRIVGGWAYALKSVEYIAKLNPSTNFEIVFGHADEFGKIPKFPIWSNIRYHTYTVKLSSLRLLYPNNPSSQHGALLNFIIKIHQLDTLFYAILDPDCYLLQQNTFLKLTHYMISNDVHILGISYPSTFPRNYYWDFPTAYFSLINSKACQPNQLNFYPDEFNYDKVESQDRVDEILFKVDKILKQLILGIHQRIFSKLKKRRAITVFFRNLPNNLPYRDRPLARDTGWVNRENLNSLKVEVIPHTVFVENLHTKFNSQAYLATNDDVKVSGIDPVWHFLNYGVHENRTFGEQPLRYRLLIKLLKNYRFDPSTYPATSLKAGHSVFESIHLPVERGNFIYAYEYSWEGIFFCIHLGHKAKENQNIDLYKLSTLLDHLMLEAEDGGK